MTTPTERSEREAGWSFRIVGEPRPDGRVFVTSPGMRFFCGVFDNTPEGLMQAVDLFRAYLERNPDALTAHRKAQPIPDSGEGGTRTTDAPSGSQCPYGPYCPYCHRSLNP